MSVVFEDKIEKILQSLTFLAILNDATIIEVLFSLNKSILKCSNPAKKDDIIFQFPLRKKGHTQTPFIDASCMELYKKLPIVLAVFFFLGRVRVRVCWRRALSISALPSSVRRPLCVTSTDYIILSLRI